MCIRDRDKVGEDYDKGTAFLPQLLSAAQAAQAVFEVIRSSIAAKGGVPVKKGKLIVATVQGDIHDIGKNIVKTVLGNYGYEVLDLGRDVPPETILRTVQEQGVRLVEMCIRDRYRVRAGLRRVWAGTVDLLEPETGTFQFFQGGGPEHRRPGDAA